MKIDQYFFLVDPIAIERRFFKDANLLNEVLAHFVNSYQKSLLKIHKSIETPDANGLADAIHSLRGSTLNFVQDPFLDELQKMELAARNHGQILLDQHSADQMERLYSDLILRLSQIALNWEKQGLPLKLL